MIINNGVLNGFDADLYVKKIKFFNQMMESEILSNVAVELPILLDGFTLPTQGQPLEFELQVSSDSLSGYAIKKDYQLVYNGAGSFALE